MLSCSGPMETGRNEREYRTLSESAEAEVLYAMDFEDMEPNIRSRAAYMLADGKSTCAMVAELPDGTVVSAVLMTATDPMTYAKYHALATATTLQVRPGYQGGPSTRTGFLALVAEVREYVIARSAELTLDT